jgi:hypothetical protein
LFSLVVIGKTVAGLFNANLIPNLKNILTICYKWNFSETIGQQKFQSAVFCLSWAAIVGQKWPTHGKTPASGSRIPLHNPLLPPVRPRVQQV